MNSVKCNNAFFNTTIQPLYISANDSHHRKGTNTPVSVKTSVFKKCFHWLESCCESEWRSLSDDGLHFIIKRHCCTWWNSILILLVYYICWLQLVTQHHTVTWTMYCHTPFLLKFKDWSLRILEKPERGCQVFPLYILLFVLQVIFVDFVLSLVTVRGHVVV